MRWTALALLGLVSCTQAVPGPDSCPPGTRFCKTLRYEVPPVYYGRCLSDYFWCDGKEDCLDGIDEQDCSTCKRGARKCSFSSDIYVDSSCMRIAYWRDGTKDCKNGEDENFSSSSYDMFRCPNGKYRAKSLLCDGWNDCGDWGDEKNCTKEQCEDHHGIWCDGGCVDASHRCDGYEFCYDGRDEKGCPAAPESASYPASYPNILLYVIATSSLLLSLGTIAFLVGRHLRKTEGNTSNRGPTRQPFIFAPEAPEYAAVSYQASDCGQEKPSGAAFKSCVGLEPGLKSALDNPTY